MRSGESQVKKERWGQRGKRENEPIVENELGQRISKIESISDSLN